MEKEKKEPYWLSYRRQKKNELLKMILENKDIPLNTVCGIFSQKTGLKLKTINEYLNELKEGKLLDTNINEGAALKMLEEERKAQEAEAAQEVEQSKIDKAKAARKNQLIEDISNHRRVIVRITDELLDDRVKEEDKVWKRDNLEKAKIVLNRLEKELEEFDKE